ncbi:hypothetical protein EJ06DRAFT_525898 [Trichodelitschia bisporula]|uniref:Uncharacterized protein n=1 Tax=Trichodelitschia bisporula TaxID=703511 RepID=A0A6G1IAS5_9PEZI|nr:hypothetical protein EJ06DRAFT_525898 [Trichodelitschia bisporula]
MAEERSIGGYRAYILERHSTPFTSLSLSNSSLHTVPGSLLRVSSLWFHQFIPRARHASLIAWGIYLGWGLDCCACVPLRKNGPLTRGSEVRKHGAFGGLVAHLHDAVAKNSPAFGGSPRV